MTLAETLEAIAEEAKPHRVPVAGAVDHPAFRAYYAAFTSMRRSIRQLRAAAELLAPPLVVAAAGDGYSMLYASSGGRTAQNVELIIRMLGDRRPPAAPVSSRRSWLWSGGGER